METIVLEVTPKQAQEWIEYDLLARDDNPDVKSNRNISKNNLQYFCDEIANGHWKLTHQGIAISSEGIIIDGQHRLRAIAKTGIPVKIPVTFGADIGTFDAIDVGKNRNFVDIYRVDKSAVAVATTMLSLSYGYTSTAGARIRAQEMGRALEKLKPIITAFGAFANSNVRVRGASPVKTAFFLHYAKSKDVKYIDMFGAFLAQDFESLTNKLKGLLRYIDKKAPKYWVSYQSRRELLRYTFASMEGAENVASVKIYDENAIDARMQAIARSVLGHG